MATKFQIQNLIVPELKVLARGFGLPLVKRSFINKQEIEESDKKDGTSLFNTPLYGTLFIHAPTYSTFEYNENDKTYTESVALLNANKRIGNDNGVFVEGVIIDISQPRNIVMTAISGLDGTVKEFINNGDYAVTIKGYFANSSPDKYPAEDVAILNSYLLAPVPLTMTNVFLNDYFGITNLVITNYSFFQQEGIRNVQYFELQCVSDTPNEILEKNG
jgi:hypothetical protein